MLTKIETKWNSETSRREVVSKGEPQFVGATIKVETQIERIMSDVYDDVSYAVVMTPEGGFTRICVGGCEFGWNYEVKTDATPEVVAAYEAHLAAVEKAAREAEIARYEAEAKARAEAEAKAPRRGRKVIVTRGRKVAKGTTGVVFWARDGRIGIATSDRMDSNGKHLDVAWCDADYAEALPEGNSEEEVEARIASWKATWKAACDAKHDAAVAEEKAHRDAEFTAATDEVPF